MHTNQKRECWNLVSLQPTKPTFKNVTCENGQGPCCWASVFPRIERGMTLAKYKLRKKLKLQHTTEWWASDRFMCIPWTIFIFFCMKYKQYSPDSFAFWKLLFQQTVLPVPLNFTSGILWIEMSNFTLVTLSFFFFNLPDLYPVARSEETAAPPASPWWCHWGQFFKFQFQIWVLLCKLTKCFNLISWFESTEMIQYSIHLFPALTFGPFAKCFDICGRFSPSQDVSFRVSGQNISSQTEHKALDEFGLLVFLKGKGCCWRKNNLIHW